MRALQRRAPLALGALTALLYLVSIYMGYTAKNEDLLSGLTWGGSALCMALIGAFLATRQPRNLIGWLLLLAGFFETVAGAADLYGELAVALSRPLPLSVPVSWFGGSTWAFSAAILLVFLPLYFPTGAPPTPRWRWVAGLAIAGIFLLFLSTFFVAFARPELMAEEWEVIEARTADVKWIFTVSDLGFPVLMAAGPLALLSLVVRFFRSRGVERQQLKLLAFAGGGTITFVLASNLLDLPRVPEALASAVAMPSLGIATMIAVLRYRLFEIDRVVSRTLSYGLLTALLVGIYLAAVTLLTTAMAPVTRKSSVAVAAATLIAAAAFQPARRRIQSLVDRRFNRARYDARKTLAAFSSSLRQQVDIDDVHQHLIGTVDSILNPADVRVWLRPQRTES